MDLLLERTKKGMTQQQVADEAGISRAAYTNIENGKRTPSTKIAKRIGRFLGFDWTQFYEDGKKESETA